MKIKSWTVVLLIASVFLSLFGCGKKHILDGPGMVNDQPWKAFTLSRSDSYSQYNFCFTVEQGNFAFLLTGECRDEAGELYTIEEAVELSTEDLQFLRELKLADLPDEIPNEDDGLILLDAPVIKLTVTFIDNQEVAKSLSEDASIQIYQRFLPYFINN